MTDIDGGRKVNIGLKVEANSGNEDRSCSQVGMVGHSDLANSPSPSLGW